jgi:superfamily II DNA or RNA helicase
VSSSFDELEALGETLRLDAAVMTWPARQLRTQGASHELDLAVAVLTQVWPELTVGQVLHDQAVHAYLRDTGRSQAARALVAKLKSLRTVERRTGRTPGLDELAAWAVAHGVGWALDCFASRVGLAAPRWSSGLYYYTVSLKELTVAEVLGPERQRAQTALDMGLERTLIGQIVRLAELGREGAAEPEPVVPRPAKDAVAAAWLGVVEARYAVVRQLVAPRPAMKRMAVTEVRFDDQARMHAMLTDPLVTESRSDTQVSLSVARDGEGEVAETCGCTPRTPARCDHVLALYQWLIDAIAGGELSEQAQLAMQPAWQRTLTVLAGLVSEAAPPGRLGFLLKPEPQLQLRAVEDPDGPKRGRQIPLRSAMASNEWEHDALEILQRMGDGRVGYRAQLDDLCRALRLLQGHTRLLVQDGGRRLPLVVQRGTLVLAARPGVTSGYELDLEIEGASVPAEAGREVIATAGERYGLWIDAPAGRAVVVDVDRRLPEAWRVLQRHKRELPAEAEAVLAAQLPKLAASLPLRTRGALLGDEVAAEPVFILRLTPEGDIGCNVEALVRVLPEADALPVGEGAVQVSALRAERRVWAPRDLATERAAAAAVLGRLDLAWEHEARWQLMGERALELLALLPELPPDWRVEWPESAPRTVSATSGKGLRLTVHDRRDWFGLDGGIAVDGELLELQAMLTAVRERRRFVQLGANRWVRLADDLRARLEGVADLAYRSKHGLEISALAGAALAVAGFEVKAPRRWSELLARRTAAERARPARPPRLNGELRDYQLDGFHWLARLAAWAPGACLADDMGLGKTIQALALMVHRQKLGPTLVIAPTSVCWNWMREMERFAPGLRGRLHESGKLSGALGPGDVVIMSYGLMARDAEALGQTRFATLVLDEAHALKNPDSQRARAALELRADFTLALTGTPLENRLAELWSLYRIIAPGLLGSWQRFREHFAVPVERDGDVERRGALQRLTQAFLLRRLKSEVAQELPPRTEVRVDVSLSADERKLYEAERHTAISSLAGVRPQEGRFQVLAALTRLRQMCLHVGLVLPDSAVPSSKLARLVELCEELRDEGHRVLIFSQFTSLLTRARAALEAAGLTSLYLDGSTPAAERKRLVDAFQNGTQDAFLISLKAGGTGLNLTGADNVIHLDPWWNPAVEDQASDRAHRIGQTRPVTIYKLVASGTIEDKLLAMQSDKRALVAGVLDGSSSPTTATLSVQDLLGILGSDTPAPSRTLH